MNFTTLHNNRNCPNSHNGKITTGLTFLIVLPQWPNVHDEMLPQYPLQHSTSIPQWP